MKADLIATRQAIRIGDTSAQAAAASCLAVAHSQACAHAFMQLSPEALRHTTSQTQVGQSPLAGLAVSIKDLFDVQGQITQAGSVVLKDHPPAVSDCLAVQRLRAAGAGLIGRTNMVEFAFSGVGTNPHYGTPAAWDGLYGQAVGSPGQAHAPGGSSSGAAVSVPESAGVSEAAEGLSEPHAARSEARTGTAARRMLAMGWA